MGLGIMKEIEHTQVETFRLELTGDEVETILKEYLICRLGYPAGAEELGNADVNSDRYISDLTVTYRRSIRSYEEPTAIGAPGREVTASGAPSNTDGVPLGELVAFVPTRSSASVPKCSARGCKRDAPDGSYCSDACADSDLPF